MTTFKLLAVKILAVMILVLGLGSAGVTGYMFFIALPPMLSTIDQTADYLANLQVPVINLEESASKIRAAAESMPGCPPQQYGGCLVLDMRDTKSELNALAGSLENVNTDVQANAASLEAQLHNTGSQLLYVRPMVLAMVGWMFGVSVILTLSGAAFLLMVRSIEKQLRPQRGVKDVILG